MKILRVLTLCLLCLPAFCQDASMFRGNPEHTGIYNAAGVTNTPQVKWKFHTTGHFISSPAVVNGVVFAGNTNGLLYAVDQESGAEKWKFKTGSRVNSSPAVVGGMVYFGSYDGTFYAVDAVSGQERWKFKTEGERRYAAKHIHGIQPTGETMPDPYDTFLSSPAIWSGAVYFGSGDGNIYALDAASGNLLWKFHTGDVVHASPAIAGGILFVGSWDTYFYALDARTGKEKWRFKTGEDHEYHNQEGIQSSAAVADGMVYFGCRDSNLYALDAQTGAKKWAYNNKGSWVIASPAVRDGKVYVGTSDSGMFYGLDGKTGASLFQLDFKHWIMFSSPAVAGNFAYTGSHDGRLLAIDLAAQKLAWTFQTDASRQNLPTYTKPDGSPKYEAAFDDSFYDSIIVGLDKMNSVGAILSSPVVVNDTIYVGSMDGNLYALR